MKSDLGGNGSPEFTIHVDDMGGWLRVHADKTAQLPDDFAVKLSLSLAQCLRERPQLHLRCIVPIQQHGNTVELHAWYELHIFPATQAVAPQ